MTREAMIDLRDLHTPGKASKRGAGASKRVQQESAAWVMPGWLKRCCLLLLLIGVFSLLFAWLAKKHAESFTVQSVLIQGEFHNWQAHAIREALLPHVQGDFFRVDLAQARAAVLQMPWVREATLRRSWPNQINVSIVEQLAISRWNNQLFLNDEGVAFSHPYIKDEHLPDLSGIDQHKRLVLQRYLQLKETMHLVGIEITGLHLDARDSWRLDCQGDVSILLGKNDFDIRLQRLLDIYQSHLIDQWHKIAVVDLRYSSGFAVRWKESQLLTLLVQGNKADV